MCWSYKVSATFTSVEVALILFLLIRSRISVDPFVRKQWLVLPSLMSVCVMEAIEAFVWSRPDELISVYDTILPNTTCAKWNQRLTVFVWIFLLPLQPLWVIMPCRRVGSSKNWQILQVPEFLAIVFAAANCFMYLISFVPQIESMMIHRTLSDSGFKSYHHNETCTYLGASGHHLHWAYGLADTYVTPNGFTYFLLWLSVLYARPLRFAAGIYLFAAGVFFTQLVYFKLSWEAGSVWCWTAMFIFVYFAVQPYVLPCKTTPNQRDEMYGLLEETKTGR